MSKVISLDDDVLYTPWQVPELAKGQAPTPGFIPRRQTSSKDSKLSEKVQKPATDNGREVEKAQLEEAYRKGYEEGLQAAGGLQDAQKQQAIKLKEIVQAMSRPLNRINDAVEAELVELSLAVAKMILRREIAEDPKHIVGLIREAIKQLPATSLNIRIHLHPDDAIVVREALSGTEQAALWQIEEDPLMHSGDCQIHTDTSFIDAGIDGLVARLASEMLGGHRSMDLSEINTDDAG